MKAKPIPTSPKNRPPQEERDKSVEDFMRGQEVIAKPSVVRFSVGFFVTMVVVSLLAGIVGTVFILFGREQWPWLAKLAGTQPTQETVVRTVTKKTESSSTPNETVKAIAQNVVGIYVRRSSVSSTAPLLEQLYMPADRRGVGVLLTEDGVGVTMRKAIPDLTKEIAVVTNDQNVYLTNQFFVDPASELVFFQISARGLPVVDFAQLESISVGDVLFSLSRQSTSLAPVLSETILATTQQQRVESRSDFLRSSERLYDLLQVKEPTDVPPGVPVFTTAGKLVGVHTGTDGDVVPVTTVQSAIQRLQKTGGVTRNVFGVRYLDLAIAKGLLIKPAAEGNTGALIIGDGSSAAIKPKSPADRAGLRSGDIVTKVNDQLLTATYSLSDAIQSITARGVATVTLSREGKEESIPVTLEVTP